MIYLQLFWSFLQIGLFSVGGGYAAMPLIQAQTVQLHGWLTMNEFTDLVTIAEMTFLISICGVESKSEITGMPPHSRANDTT